MRVRVDKWLFVNVDRAKGRQISAGKNFRFVFWRVLKIGSQFLAERHF